MRSDLIGDIMIETDGVTVWINDNQGCCIGRFGLRGIDIHRSAEAQLRGEPQCLECHHDLSDPAAAWLRFTLAMAHHYEIAIPSTYRPNHTKAVVTAV